MGDPSPPQQAVDSPLVSRLSPLLLALLSAALLALCFPYFNHTYLVWIALVPLFIALRRVRRPLHGAWLGLLFGLAFFATLHRYLLMYGVLPTFAVALLEAFPLFFFGWLAAYLLAGRSSLLSVLGLAGAWVLQEALRANLGAASLTFGQLGYTQHASLNILQTASVAGTLGIGFLIALVNAAVARVIMPGGRRAWGVLALALVLVVGVDLGGYQRLHESPPPGPMLTVGVAQPNVALHSPISPEDTEACRQAYPKFTDLLMSGLSLSLTTPGGFQRPDLVVWPETAFPVALNLQPEFMETAQQTVRRDRVTLLMGALEVRDAGKVYNTAWLFDPAGQLRGTYHKNSLVMFGEYVPYRDKLPFLQRYPIRDFDFSPGTNRDLLHLNGTPFGVLICFEAIFSRPALEEVRAGAQFLVFMTSDAWVGPSPEVLVHAYTAPLRAVETGRWVVRAAAIGQSAIISPRGEILDSVPAFGSGVAHAQVTPLSDLNFYVRHGDPPLLALCGLLVILGLVVGRRREDESEPL